MLHYSKPNILDSWFTGDLTILEQKRKAALETRDVAKQTYETTKQRFIIGKADGNSLNLILKR